MNTTTSPMQYLDKAMNRLHDMGLVPTGNDDEAAPIMALLNLISDLDQDRVAVFGGSYGGYMVLASAVHYSDRLKAAVNIVGISNFVTFLENTQDYRRDLRRAEYGDERDPDMRAHLEKISPLNSVDRITVPMMVDLPSMLTCKASLRTVTASRYTRGRSTSPKRCDGFSTSSERPWSGLARSR